MEKIAVDLKVEVCHDINQRAENDCLGKGCCCGY